jgi:RHS repeat-associated protein
MPGRKYSAENSAKYRYGFNGKENDDEVKGEGNQQDYGFRIYDPRLGRFLSVDPLTISYPWYTPYQFAGNKPIQFIDLDGLEEGPSAEFQPWQEFAIGVVEGFFGIGEESPRLTTCGTEYERFRVEAWTEQENARIDAESFEKNGIVSWGVDKVGTLVGNLEEVIVKATPRQKGRFTGTVLAIAVPVAGDIRAAFLAKRMQALTKTTKGLVNSIDEISEVASKSVDNSVTTNAAQKVKNRNSNDAVGDNILYDVHEDGAKKGQLLKIGKGKGDDLTAAGDPKRMKVSERKARAAGYPNATSTIRKKLGTTTTRQATDAEATEIKSERANGNTLPLNKEKGKKYKG